MSTLAPDWRRLYGAYIPTTGWSLTPCIVYRRLDEGCYRLAAHRHRHLSSSSYVAPKLTRISKPSRMPTNGRLVPMQPYPLLLGRIHSDHTDSNLGFSVNLPYVSKRCSHPSKLFRSHALYPIKLQLNLNEALDENSSLSYGESLAIWDQTVLPATRHK